MRSYFENPIIIRIFLSAILITLIGFSPRPHLIDQGFNQTRLAAEFGSYQDANLRLSNILDYFPGRSDLWELAGRYALQYGDFHSALSYFEKASQFGNLSYPAQIYLGDAEMQAGNLPLAITIWENLLHAGSSSPDLYTRLARAYQIQADYPEAIIKLKSLVMLQPTDAQHLYQLGLLLTAEDPSSAPTYLLNASQIDPQFTQPAETIQQSLNTARLADDPAYLYLESGRALASLGYWDLALRAFQKSTQFRPDYAEAWAYYGEAFQHTKNKQNIANSSTDESQTQEAKQALDKALELNPDSISANTLMAIFWQRQNRYGLALVYVHKAADLAPTNAALKVEAGNTLALLGNLDDAYSYYQRAVDLAPNDPSYWRALASFSVKYEYDVRKIALPAARQAILINPQDAASLDMMGQVFTLLNDRLSAQRFLQRALQINPGFAPARLHLGVVLLFEGDSNRARQELALAQSLAGTNSSVSDQAKRLLQSYFP